MRSFLLSRKSYFFLSLGTLLAVMISVIFSSPWLLPVLMTLAVYPFFAADLIAGKPRRALGHVLWWVFISSVFLIAFTRIDAGRMGQVVLKGIRYRDEMLTWILTGEGPEGDPRLFAPMHAAHFVVFSIASLLTGGLCGLAFGAILINYMNFYVASLSLKAPFPIWIYLFGWPVWSLIRVVGFVAGWVALSQPLLSAIFRFKLNRPSLTRWFAAALFLGLLDMFLKWQLAPFWRELLRRGVRM